MHTYVCIAETPIYTQPQQDAPVAQNGQARLTMGQTLSGQPDKNAMVWLASGLGFVPARTVTLCYQMEATADTPVREDADVRAPIAEQHGSAIVLRQGTHINGAYTSPTWVWLIDGTGFVEASATRVISDTVPNVDFPAASGTPSVPPTQPQPDVPVEGLLYITESGDTLWSIAERFFGDGTRWHEIYAIPQNRQEIGDNPRAIFAGKRLVLPGVEVPDMPIPAQFEWYTVEPGDTLYGIGRKINPNDENSWKHLHAINKDIIGSDASKLEVGTKIRIPSA